MALSVDRTRLGRLAARRQCVCERQQIRRHGRLQPPRRFQEHDGFGGVALIERYLAAHPVEADLDAVWERALPAAAYLYEDLGEGEGGLGAAFPHRLSAPPIEGQIDQAFYANWQMSPFADAFLGRMAAAAIADLELGRGQGTDFLAVSFSTLDTVGHAYGPRSHEVQDVLVRLAKCCTPVPGDPVVGYISLGRGITVHREDCPNVKALQRNPERFTPVEWEGGASAGFLVQISVDAWDRARLLEDVARTFAEHGANIVSYGGVVEDGMARNWYTAEVGDVKELRSLLTALRNLEAVFDAYRVTQ